MGLFCFHGNGKDVLMAKKLTYEELELRVKDLQEEAVERKRAEVRIEHLNAVLRAIRNVNQLITREKDRDRLLKAICHSLIETRGYSNAWIALTDESGALVTAVEAGLGEDFLPMLERLKRGELTECAQKTLRETEVVVVEDPYSICIGCPLAKNYSGSGAMTKGLEFDGKVYGLLTTSIPRDLITDEEEQALFKEVAGDIAFALHSLELEEERKQAEERIKQQTEFLNLVIESLPHPFYVIDAFDYTIRVANSKAHLGRLSKDKTCYALIYQSDRPCEWERRPCPLEKVKETKQPVTIEHIHYDKDGNPRNIEVHAYPILDNEGNVSQMIASSVDVTQRKRAEEQREKLIDELENALAKVKTLSGLLPICSSCKKIRDDKGYWNQIEGYIRDHSEAEFSHSICPECAKELYPELYKKSGSEIDRRQYSFDEQVLKRFVAQDRRSGLERRSGIERRAAFA